MTPHADLEAIAGVAHRPDGAPAGVVLLTHGAGGSRESPLLIALCDEWARRGWLALRYNLPYRRRRPTGPPSGSAAADQAGIVEAISTARALLAGIAGAGSAVIAGGHSYGGRLTSMVAAAQPGIVDGLTLFSYPLHPPGKPERLRTEHFGAITMPTVFTHGSSDPFGSIAELRTAVALIGAPTEIVEISGARHDLAGRRCGAAQRAAEEPGPTTLAGRRCGAAQRAAEEPGPKILRSKVTNVPAVAVDAALAIGGFNRPE